MHPHTTKHPGRLEDSVHLPEVDVEGVEEVHDVHAEDAVNGCVAQTLTKVSKTCELRPQSGIL